MPAISTVRVRELHDKEDDVADESASGFQWWPVVRLNATGITKKTRRQTMGFVTFFQRSGVG